MALNGEEVDLELRDAVLQVLEESGALNKIKAELRCRVFQALYDSKQLQGRVPRSRALQFVGGSESNCSEGRLILSLVKDLLQQLDLTFTLSVFEAELNDAQTLLSRKETAAALDVDITENPNEPLLASLVHLALDERSSAMGDTAPDPLVRRTSSHLNAADVQNMFAEQSFFAQLDKGDSKKPDEVISKDLNDNKEVPTLNTTTEATDPIKHQLNEKQPTNEEDQMKNDKNVEKMISPPRSPEKVPTDIKETPIGILAPLKPLSSLKNLPQLQAPSKLPSLKRPPPEISALKPLEGDSGDDVESLGEDLASLGSDSATATLEVSASLAEIPGGDYVENISNAR